LPNKEKGNDAKRGLLLIKKTSAKQQKFNKKTGTTQFLLRIPVFLVCREIRV
jgi:hypothetical protein